MSLERRLSLITSLIIALTLGIGGFIFYNDGRGSLAAGEKEQIEATGLVLTTTMSQAESLTVSHSELLAQDPAVIELMRTGDRTALQARMKPVFDSLKVDAGADVLHFHTADMKSFLRVWSPDDYGQDLSRIRPMILSANKHAKSQKGLEIGLSGLSLRAVSPIRSEGVVVGTVEVGVSLKTLMELAKSSTGADFAIFLDPQFIPDGKGGHGEKGAALQLGAATDSQLFDDLQSRGLVHLTRSAESSTTRLGDIQLGLLNRPLLDYSGKMIGTLIVAKDFTAIEAGFRATLVTVAVVAICGLLIAYGVLMVMLRALVFRPLEKLAADRLGGEVNNPAVCLSTYLRIRSIPLQEPLLANTSLTTDNEH
ncbi:hypothetical protein JJB09_02005 [Rhizobium sp. KVB221]|uniref:Double Cache domain-containing protein n=1 Tax=Rhizobium setariae TaxID=2801340 RepID=A0A937CKS4_9HYPH|nr:cache domain-containing protein [Rhizobium setariae]MBL0370791.1 hypothetical protein [Rhizobium setariae]